MKDKEFNFLVEEGYPGRYSSSKINAAGFDLITNHKERPDNAVLVGGFISIWDNEDRPTLIDIALTRTVIEGRTYFTTTVMVGADPDILTMVVPYFTPDEPDVLINRICNTVEAFAPDLAETVRSGFDAILNVDE